MDIAFAQREKDIVLGTFGRGAWVIDDIEPLRVLAAGADLSEAVLSLSRPWLTSGSGNKVQECVLQEVLPLEERTVSFGARQAAYLPEVAKDNKKKLRIDYQNDAGDTLYTQYMKVKEAGMVNWRWAMWEKGTDYPEFKVRDEKKEQSDERGAPVVPGRYKATMNWDGKPPVTTIEVNTITA